MISLENVTTTSTSSSPIVSQEETSSLTLSFSELLRGIGTTKETPTAQNGVVVLALDSEQENQASKPDTLLSLLKTTDSLDGEEDLLLDSSSSAEDVNLDKLSSSELKTLMKDAKNYLKDQIVTSDGFKKSEADSLPKTLKGLAQVADKYGIDVSKITLDEIQVDSKTATQTSLELKKGFQNTKERSITRETTSISEEEIVDLDSKLQDKSKTDVKSSALFKAQGSKEITTEQFVQTRLSSSNPAESKTSKQKADDTLQMLLRGEKSTKSDSGLTVDFSVATARVIAPQATTETRSSLESLLSGEEKESSSSTATSTSSKTDSLTVSKADSFEVKLNEAKQMTKYLSADVKTAIEDYKSPFTRVKVQLNPQNLGEVDLTIVQRGKNLHINLSSNNAAINTLALNANDLKAQLSNNGINNATLNFNNNSQSSDPSFSGGQQQQNPQQGRDANREYNYFENEEQNEELLNSLEIVVPYYA